MNLLIERLREKIAAAERKDQTGVVIDIFPWLNFTTFDIFGNLGFGGPFNCFQNSEDYPWIAMMFNSVKAASFVATTRFYPLIDSMLEKCNPLLLNKIRTDHFNFILCFDRN